MKLSHFTKLFTQTILRRGKIYWEHGLVTIKEFDGQTYTATVKGTQNYTTTATLDGDEVVNISCTCPYGSRCISSAWLTDITSLGLPHAVPCCRGN